MRQRFLLTILILVIALSAAIWHHNMSSDLYWQTIDDEKLYRLGRQNSARIYADLENRRRHPSSPEMAISIGSQVRIRTQPGLDAEVFGYLEEGEPVTVLQKSTFTSNIDGRSEHWYEIITPSDAYGWVFGSFLNFGPPPEAFKKTKSSFLEPISKPEGPHKYWVIDALDFGGSSFFKSAEGASVFLTTNWEGDKARIQIDGQSIELSLVKATPYPDRNMMAPEKGDKATRIFSTDGITARVDYFIQDRICGDDTCRIKCNVNLEVTKGPGRVIKKLRGLSGG